MGIPTFIVTERTAVQRAIKSLEARDATAALAVLRPALKQRKGPGPKETDHGDIQLTRAFIEQAIVELEKGYPDFALKTLRRAAEKVVK